MMILKHFFRNPVIAVAVSLILAGLLQAQDFSDAIIKGVDVRYKGAKTVDSAVIKGYMSVRPGQKYSVEKIDDDIRTLFESGLVDDVRYLAEPSGDGLRLIAEVTTRPVLSGVGFTGNTVFSDKKLANETKLKAGSTLSDTLILEGRRNIEKQYQDFGYPDMVVRHSIQPTSKPGYSELVFQIEEGPRNIVRKIRFQGNDSFDAATLRKEMETKQKGFFSWITQSGKIDRLELNQDLERIKDFYHNKGFIRVEIGKVQRVPVKDGRVDLIIPIREDRRYKVNKVAFGPMSVFEPSELAPALRLVQGDSYSADELREDVKTIRRYYGSKGYADVRVSPDIRNTSETSVDITYRITEGDSYKVGQVTIEGNNKSQDRVIRRELPLKPGDKLNAVDLDTTRSRLRNMNYFNNIQVDTEASGLTGFRDINVLVSEKKTGSVNFGLGLSSIDSVVGFATLEQTNFDIKNWKTFTGAGQRFSLNLRAGSERQDFSVSLTEPWFLGRRLALGGELFYRQSLFISEAYDQENVGAAVFLRKPVGRFSSIRGEYRIEQIDIDLEGDAETGIFADEDGSFLRSAVSLTYKFDNRDTNITPRSGHRYEVGLTYAGLGGDVDAFTLSLSGSKHWNLWWDSIVTLRGASNIVDGGNIPVFERQFLGGARNLRGFEFRDIGGPRDIGNSNEVIGGNTSAFGTVEVTVPIVEKVRGAVFADFGFVNEDSWDFDASDLYSNFGVGLRLNLPFGPIAVDFAIPVESPDEEADNGSQFNFYLDYAF